MYAAEGEIVLLAAEARTRERLEAQNSSQCTGKSKIWFGYDTNTSESFFKDLKKTLKDKAGGKLSMFYDNPRHCVSETRPSSTSLEIASKYVVILDKIVDNELTQLRMKAGDKKLIIIVRDKRCHPVPSLDDKTVILDFSKFNDGSDMASSDEIKILLRELMDSPVHNGAKESQRLISEDPRWRPADPEYLTVSTATVYLESVPTKKPMNEHLVLEFNGQKTPGQCINIRKCALTRDAISLVKRSCRSLDLSQVTLGSFISILPGSERVAIASPIIFKSNLFDEKMFNKCKRDIHILFSDAASPVGGCSWEDVTHSVYLSCNMLFNRTDGWLKFIGNKFGTYLVICSEIKSEVYTDIVNQTSQYLNQSIAIFRCYCNISPEKREISANMELVKLDEYSMSTRSREPCDRFIYLRNSDNCQLIIRYRSEDGETVFPCSLPIGTIFEKTFRYSEESVWSMSVNVYSDESYSRKLTKITLAGEKRRPVMLPKRRYQGLNNSHFNPLGPDYGPETSKVLLASGISVPHHSGATTAGGVPLNPFTNFEETRKPRSRTESTCLVEFAINDDVPKLDQSHAISTSWDGHSMKIGTSARKNWRSLMEAIDRSIRRGVPLSHIIKTHFD
ncbi:uncharacterized protein LOC141899920 [Tubulanus polymorphus]|uniref:uncharacterized protein LOC141899920 n=1 Tax=Tubulanus polymorphus TaxID=672921 RepID=UPI003DA50B38